MEYTDDSIFSKLERFEIKNLGIEMRFHAEFYFVFLSKLPKLQNLKISRASFNRHTRLPEIKIID